MKFTVIKQNYPKFDTDNPFRIFKCQLCDFDPSFQTKYGYFSLKGNLPFMSVGQTYDYQLALVEENQYGFTYEVQQDFSLNVDEMSEELQKQILESVTSSKDIVESIMSVYPNYVKLIISGQQDEIDISLIHNVGAYRHGIYCEKIINNYKVFSMQSELSHWDLTIDEVRELFLRFNLTEEINHQFVEHPYETYCGILDREFEDVDMFVVKDMPQHKVSFERCEWCVIDVLRLNEIELKNTRMNANDMVQYVPKELRPILVETVLKSDRIYYDNENKWVSLESTYHAEKRIADKLKAILSNSIDLGFETEKYKGELTDEQFSVLDVVNKSSACILTGSGGCGKSFTTKAIVDMLLDNDMSVRLVAPTGIASKVSSRYTGLQATTIHSACLSCKYDFPEDVIIVDEASMVSIETMDMLCQHLNEYHRIIFVADRRQLPSITAGNVFSDIVDSGLLPCVTLTKVFRFNSSGIAQVTTNTRNNIKRNVAERQFDDYDFITLSNDPLEQIDEVYTKCLEKYQPDDILILSPYNKQSCGTRAINNYIQSIHNPSDVELGYKVDGTNVMFHVGDLVINTKNNYQAVSEKRWEYNERVKFLMESGKLPTDFEPENFDDVFIANGDIGTVAWIKGDTLCVMFKDENIIYEKSELKNLLLAYAISIHKSQGCEAKCVIVIESKQHRNLSRNAIYVATSRAKEYLCEIGDEQKINDAMEQDEAEIRCTWLKDLLQKS